jgi:sensor histidine kinase YesM
MNKLNDFWVRVVGVPLTAAVTLIFVRTYAGSGPVSGWLPWADMLVKTFIGWETLRQVVLRIRGRYPGLNQTKPRIAWTVLAALLVSFLLLQLYTLHILWMTNWVRRFSLLVYASNTVLGMLFTLIAVGIYEAVYLYREWRRKTAEAATLRREHVERQLDLLKSQINPHFLFNSFNVLASLIQTDPKRAVAFLDELSSVYRYLLRANRADYSTLADELAFIQAYFVLLQTRFAEGISLTIDVPDHYIDKQLPTLTLQLLVENAVKHNIVSVSRPLRIQIRVADGRLVVENNLQKKRLAVTSGKVGLSNIAAKYALRGPYSITVEDTDGRFRLTLPLLATASDRPRLPTT